MDSLKPNCYLMIFLWDNNEMSAMQLKLWTFDKASPLLISEHIWSPQNKKDRGISLLAGNGINKTLFFSPEEG